MIQTEAGKSDSKETQKKVIQKRGGKSDSKERETCTQKKTV